MADEFDPFRPSRRLVRTPPVQLTNQPNESHILDPSQQSCNWCSENDTLEMVQCDECKNWSHFKCVNVTADVVNVDFKCPKCRETSEINQQKPEEAGSRKSKISSSRSESRRQQLALERIEEERKLREERDKEYLDKKYKALETFSLGSSSDIESQRSGSKISTKKRTESWVKSLELSGVGELFEEEPYVYGAQNVLSTTAESSQTPQQQQLAISNVTSTIIDTHQTLQQQPLIMLNVPATLAETTQTFQQPQLLISNVQTSNVPIIQTPQHQLVTSNVQSTIVESSQMLQQQQLAVVQTTAGTERHHPQDIVNTVSSQNKTSLPHQGYSSGSFGQLVTTTSTIPTFGQEFYADFGRLSTSTNIFDRSIATDQIWGSNRNQPVRNVGDKSRQFTPIPWQIDAIAAPNRQIETVTQLQSSKPELVMPIPITVSTVRPNPTNVSQQKKTSASINASVGYKVTFTRSFYQPPMPLVNLKSTASNLSKQFSTNYAVTPKIQPSAFTTASQEINVSNSTSTTQSTARSTNIVLSDHQPIWFNLPKRPVGQYYGQATYTRVLTNDTNRGPVYSTSTLTHGTRNQFGQSTTASILRSTQSSTTHQSTNGGQFSPSYAPSNDNYQQRGDAFQFSSSYGTVKSHPSTTNVHQSSTNSHRIKFSDRFTPYFDPVKSQPSTTNAQQSSTNSQKVTFSDRVTPSYDPVNTQPSTARVSQFSTRSVDPNFQQSRNNGQFSSHYDPYVTPTFNDQQDEDSSQEFQEPTNWDRSNDSAPNAVRNIDASKTFKLTPEQVAARQTVGKTKLPVFYGDVEKFPKFIRAYETSTELCGFTNGENLNRLLGSLQGDAYDWVDHQLIYPDDVPNAIATLKELYGQAEFVIEKLLDKISKQPSPRADDLPSLIKFAMSVQGICGTIKTAELTEHLTNPSLMKALIDKLPPSIQLDWAKYKQSIPNANLDTLGAWLRGLATLATSIAGPPKVKSRKEKDKSSGYVNAQVEGSSNKDNASNSQEKVKKCPACKQPSCQTLKDCKKFIELDIDGRWNIVRENGICLRCLKHHTFKSCRSKQKCNTDGCQKAHNALLHDKSKNKKDAKDNTKSDIVSANCSHQTLTRKKDIFRIVPVILRHGESSISTFAYLDDGSNLTMIEDKLANELGLESSSEDNLCVKWSFKKVQKQELSSRRVSVTILGVYPNAPSFSLHNVRTVEELALPSQTISRDWLDMYAHFKNISITTYENGRPRILIGLQYSKLMVSQRTIEGKWSEPIACKTRLGWVVQGPDGDETMNIKSDLNFSCNMCECQPDDTDLHAMVKEFFSWESFGTKVTDKLIESKENQRARKILEETTRKINDRYETGLLWRYDDVKFPNTYPMALQRLECLERKMKKDPILATKMCEYIQDFIQKGYVRKLTPDELKQNNSRVCYLPLFPVFNPKKPEKFRVVWDAAATVKKVSLNSMLLAGPDQLNPLPDVIRRFRERRVAVTGDMTEMFHQVRVIDSDVHAQRFLWRDGNSERKPEEYVVNVLTFGGKNSPSSAQYVKNTNALEYKSQFPRAVEAIVHNHYQDDMLESMDTVEEIVRLAEEVKLIHQNGGFKMRNFKSNSTEVLERLGEKMENHYKNLNLADADTTERVLGMFWDTVKDTFTFSLKFAKLPEDVLRSIRRPTKREVLKAMMSVFDPLGLIAHVLVYGKILLQQIWREGTDWDEQLSDSAYEHWSTWIQVLPGIEQIEIPRWYSTKLYAANQKRIQLHIFMDASVNACAALAYYRIEDEEGVDCCLIGAKTKVAPNKPLSVPRLELQAAVLGVRFAENITGCHTIQATERYFWSDSQTVLGWVNSEARKFHQYVAFRVGEIAEKSSTTEWHYVNTKENVADDATKWKGKPDLSSTSRWFKGPSFLYQPQESWDKNNEATKFNTDEEMRSVHLLVHIEMPSNNIINVEKFSNWNRLRRVIAQALRFIDNLRTKKQLRKVGPITREEYIRAQNTLFRQAQRDEFTDEILIITHNESVQLGERKELHKSSALRTCSPYLDENGILRIKGRIDSARSVSFSTKRPIILPRNHYITKLLVLSYHQKYHHVNHQTTLNEINRTLYVPALRAVLKTVIQNLCQRCVNDKAKPAVPEMSELPPARLSTFTRPFTYVGVDYFGPMKIKDNRLSKKRWGMIFTCLTTRAVYIDVAHSYDTASCIYCIRNFMNRNNTPLEIYSDNGSNFLGSERELREEFQKMNKTKIQEAFTNENTQWFFNPPTAPHMGGSWERLIRTVKVVLYKSMPTRLPTDEMLRSYLTEVENILNSRPLTYIQLDHIDDEVLTPNHFLKGSSNGTQCPGRFDSKNLLRNDWRAVQEMTNQFWKRFVVEFIPTLTRRTKWFKDVKNIEVGDLVIDMDDEGERNTWKKGIVEKVAIGRGNKVRRAFVRMIRGDKASLANKDVTEIRHQSLWRPAAKLAVLDVRDKLSSSTVAVNGEGNVVNTPLHQNA